MKTNTTIRKTMAVLLALLALFILPSCEVISQVTTTNSGSSSASGTSHASDTGKNKNSAAEGAYTVDNVPDFTDKAYVEINNNVPYFKSSEYMTKAYEDYSELDSLGRCGTAFACVCMETMPTEKRGNISQVKPTGWQSVTYDFVDGKSLYNRCHLIGFQLTAENANKKNLITGTRYMNTKGMLPFENMVADYVKETKNHVMYRVTPIFDGNNLVARGVEMEAYSVEDKGEGVSYNVYVYNNQPGVSINYADGTSQLAGDQNSSQQSTVSRTEYVINVNNKKVHLPSCSSVKNIKDENKKTVKDSLDHLIEEGYIPCGNCLPQE